ncbi:hypothetical protein [Paenibacillus polymyxa]|uniref:hypothetical protein n=1 Tax=Paenibacillus polymyxa TaxID=1406 RepID=UPI001867990B|nr:hypothetical protein [Paenibacillus polymyxa]MBE3649195.1 hypothetical protein [Paenibacillus polymyxa]
MAEYHASPRYSLDGIEFDVSGVYVTEDAGEIARLDALVPTWISRIDVKEPEEPKKPRAKKAQTTGTSDE